ncbi:MAG: HlyD family efflux transporter periplasmic adaptor subunit, partial [Bacteroidota bacterium]
PLEQQQIVAEVQGQALPTRKLLTEGVKYAKGETMILIEDDQYALNLSAQKSQFRTALVRIMSQIQLDYPSAHPDWDKYLTDFDEKKILPALPEVSDGQLRNFLSANNVFSSFYSIKSAEELLPKYKIKAPFNGVIAQGSVSAGAVINPGTPLGTIHRSDVYELKASVSSKNIDQLRPGLQIELIHNNTGETWSGRVHRLGSTMDRSSQAIPIFIRVSGKGLRAGMFLEAELDGDVLEQVVKLPIEALNRNNQVHFIQNNTVELKSVEPLRYEKAFVWVKGLNGGEEVIVEEILEPIVGSKMNAQ